MPNRLLCDVLESMRQCYKTRNFAPILGLVEEAQLLGDRMEAALQDQHEEKDLRADIKNLRETKQEFRDEIGDLHEQRDDLLEEVNKLEERVHIPPTQKRTKDFLGRLYAKFKR